MNMFELLSLAKTVKMEYNPDIDELRLSLHKFKKDDVYLDKSMIDGKVWLVRRKKGTKGGEADEVVYIRVMDYHEVIKRDDVRAMMSKIPKPFLNALLRQIEKTGKQGQKVGEGGG